MDLHAVVSGAIGTVNPFVVATIQRSAGYTTEADGMQVPQYETFTARMQVQALTYSDLRQIDGLNIQGTRRAIYLNGEVAGQIRVAQRGGDLVIFPDGTLPEGNTWLAAYVLEQWPDWCKVVITLQNTP